MTGIGAFIGIPLILLGLLAPLAGLSSIKAPCPYCGAIVYQLPLIHQEGITCSTCKKRIVVRDRKFHRVD